MIYQIIMSIYTVSAAVASGGSCHIECADGFSIDLTGTGYTNDQTGRELCCDAARSICVGRGSTVNACTVPHTTVKKNFSKSLNQD